MALVFLPALARMAVCGGTHGNELSGVYVVQEMERQWKEKGECAWPIPVTTVLSNPRAVKECRRYIEKDMNRCFNRATLSSPITDSSPYEVRRAHELNNLLGPKGSTDAIDLICDLHNTTANMGLTLIHYTTSDWVTLHICKYLQTKLTKVPVRVLVLDVPISDAYSLESVSKHGFSIEVGPQPHGVVRADIYTIMKEAVDLTIDWIHKFSSGTVRPNQIWFIIVCRKCVLYQTMLFSGMVFEGGDVEAFRFIKSVDYPRDPETRTLTAAIHPQLQVPVMLLFIIFTQNQHEHVQMIRRWFILESVIFFLSIFITVKY
uniref:Succinylglutamate desuccinylase/Aspartoacylase catalytic domain-containing protein n=1 Tax=Cyprinus carpio TaxID=7962 RepID=A0A8C1PJW0_CYPCA